MATRNIAQAGAGGGRSTLLVMGAPGEGGGARRGRGGRAVAPMVDAVAELVKAVPELESMRWAPR